LPAALLLTARKFPKLLIFGRLNWLPCFLAEQEKSFAEMGLAHLMTVHSQIYPQLLGISCGGVKKGATNCRLPRSQRRGKIPG